MHKIHAKYRDRCRYTVDHTRPAETADPMRRWWGGVHNSTPYTYLYTNTAVGVGVDSGK
jgi:hypothetical protein